MVHRRLKLGSKLLACFIFAGILPLLLIGVFTMIKTRQDLTHQAYAKLESVKDIKKAWIEDLYADWRRDITYLAEMSSILLRTAYHQMDIIHHIRKREVESFMKTHLDNVLSISKSSAISDALSRFTEAYRLDGQVRGPTYSYLESRFETTFQEICKTGGYDTLYLITKDGDVIYSFSKGTEEGKNLNNGDLAESPLASCFRRSLNSLYLHDFEAYAIQNNRQVMFIGAPILRYGQNEGVVIVQLNHEGLNQIMQQREGLHKTGETFLVGLHHGEITYRNDRIIRKGKLGEKRGGQDVESAVSGKSGRLIRKGTDGFLVMSTYSPVDIPGLAWAVISTIGVEEVINPVIKDGQVDLMTRYIRNFQYEDLLLIHTSGEVLYSVKRGKDYRENLVRGQFRDSSIGQLFKNISNTGQIQMSDIQKYDPDGRPALFIGAPVLVDNQSVQLVAALRIDILQINQVMTRREGMGVTGQTYLVGQDRLMRSDAVIDSADHSVSASFENPQKGAVDTEAVREALAGNSGSNIQQNYAGKKVLSSYAPILFENTTWAMIAEIHYSEALKTLRSLQTVMTTVSAGCFMLIVLTAFWLTRSISRPIRKISRGLDSATSQLVSTADEMSASSQTLSENASEQAASIEETSAALDEIKEMSHQTSQLTKGAEELMKQNIKNSTQSLKSLIELTQEMSDIEADNSRIKQLIKSIEEIAFQTNLLALNAAIEAARAGGSGTGFAVVADEVRNLSHRTSDAADMTQTILTSISNRISKATTSIRTINVHFEGIIESATIIGDKTSSVTHASHEQAKRIEQIVSATHDIDQVTQKIAAASEETASVSEQMYAQSEHFRAFVLELAELVDGGRRRRRGK